MASPTLTGIANGNGAVLVLVRAAVVVTGLLVVVFAAGVLVVVLGRVEDVDVLTVPGRAVALGGVVAGLVVAGFVVAAGRAGVVEVVDGLDDCVAGVAGVEVLAGGEDVCAVDEGEPAVVAAADAVARAGVAAAYPSDAEDPAVDPAVEPSGGTVTTAPAKTGAGRLVVVVTIAAALVPTAGRTAAGAAHADTATTTAAISTASARRIGPTVMARRCLVADRREDSPVTRSCCAWSLPG